MKIPADLHIHSPYSRATSPRLSPAWLDRWARIKGIGLLGTGDCTHARWLEELREQLDQGEEGFYTLKREIRSAFNSGPALEEGLPEPGEDAPSLRFVLTGEISTIYKKDGKTRKVHHLVILPGFSSAAAFNAKLERLGNIRSDGRPILGIDSRDLLSLLLETDENAILIPAHIWTPWFSVLGAKSGFDSIDACYGDLASYIPAVETGLSSNPPMNWALSGLDRFSIISNSDAHSPDKLGREATIFEMEQSYASLRKALRHEGGKILGTIEFFPQEGKYHYDGHRKCGVCLDPAEAAAAGGICPVCGKVLTRGVMSRVLELADREVDETAVCPPDTEAANRRPYYSLIPLNEILGELLGRGGGSKKVEAAYGNLIKKGGSEFSLLMEKDLACIEGLKIPGLSGELLAEAIGRMRSGKVLVDPGYDGEYGSVKVFDGKVPAFMGGSLFEELPGIKSAEKAPGIPKAAAGKKDGPKRNAPAPPQGGTFSFVPDQAQQEAVAYNGRRALIIAGPGTGKTAVLADRIVRLIEKEGADPASILAVSFTIKAAAELRERILRFSDPSGGGDPAAVTAATFHSFCCSVLREEYAAAGLRQDFKILGEEERDALLAGICSSDKNRRGRKKTAPRRLGGYIEERKRFLLLPGETTSLFAAECPAPDPLLEELYGEYRLSLREGGALDFEDLVAGAVRLLFAQERVLRSLRRRFRYIFVDEYQDINLAQYALIRRLAPGDDESPSLWVIGDPDQAIYGFRGSDKRFIDRFLEDYPEACRFELTRSFRCAEPIIRAAGQLTGKQLKGVSLEAPDTELKLFRTGYPSAASEAEGIARSIAGLVGGTSFFAIDSLRRVHTPAPWGGTKGMYPESNTLREQHTPTACGGVVDSDAAGQGELGLGPGDCAVLVRTAALAEGIVKALNDHGIPFDLTGQSVWWEEEPVKTLIGALKKNRFRPQPDRAAAPPGAEIKETWASLFPGRRYEEAEGVKELLRVAEISGDLPSLLDGLACSSAEGMTGIRRQGVKVMTIHASKGLEFDQVFLPGLEEGVLPFTLYGNKDIDEERRLLYVAMTRARRGLWLSWAQSRTLGNRKCSGSPSRFLSELENIPLALNNRPFKRDLQLKLF